MDGVKLKWMLALALAAALAAAPGCSAGSLSATASLQGATGSLLGGIELTNVGRRACVLPERPVVRLMWGGRIIAVRRTTLPVRAAPLGLLKPGKSAFAGLQWRNWCGERPSGDSPFRPRLLLTLARGRGTLRVELQEPVTAPRCAAPLAASTLAVGHFVAR